MELNELLHLLEERLVQHDNNRKEVQNKLEELCTGMSRDADLLEERLNEELQSSFNEREEGILNLTEKLNSAGEDDRELLVEQVHEELSTDYKYEIQYLESEINFVDSYKLKITSIKTSVNVNVNDTEDVINLLKGHLNKIHEITISVQNELTEICTKRKNDAEELKKRINEKLEFHFVQEDTRIQEAVNMIKTKDVDKNTEELKTKAKLVLLVNQKYSLNNDDDLIISKEPSLKHIDFEERKPSNIITSFTDKGEFSLSFTFFSDDEIKVLQTLIKSPFKVTMKLWEKINNNNENNSKIITKDYILGDEQICFVEPFYPNTIYCLKLRIEQQDLPSKWSDNAEFITPEFKICVWKECPYYVENDKMYSVDKKNLRIAKRNDISRYNSTIVGNTPLPSNKVISWNIKILNSKDNDCSGIYIGVASFDIDQNYGYNFDKCGWYFHCYRSLLYSGPPHKYKDKEYGLRKGWGRYVHTGDTIGVVMDTTKGDLSFVLNGVNLGVAYEGIPLDKPLVPCVLLCYKGDSVELDTSEVKENVDSSIPVPLNITAKSVTWDSITLTWNAVDGASFYQIEVDGTNHGDVSTTNSFIKWRLLEGSEYSFRVRTVKDNKVGRWSDVVKGRTIKISDFSECAWKECPKYLDKDKKYSVDVNNSRIATNITGYYCTIIGNASLPLNKVTSWNIKILKSLNNDGSDIYVGVAPFDINQNEDDNSDKCGWYFNCYDSMLYSGPPHNYDQWSRKKYGLRKEYGKYVHKGDIIGVVMNTIKGELSFVLNGMKYGIAYEGIPLDKPLVPCVLLFFSDDSVELGLSEMKENSCIIV